MRLKDKVAIVTGSGRGIGRDIALAYAREGAHVVVNDIDPATAVATAADIVKAGGRSLASPGDVARKAEVDRLVAAAMAEFGRIDIRASSRSSPRRRGTRR